MGGERQFLHEKEVLLAVRIWGRREIAKYEFG